MKAALFEHFRTPLHIRDVTDLCPHPDAVVITVRACGICRSDWHAWMGHDSDVQLPHVPGHELAGTIAAIGSGVEHWQPGQRVTAPFCCGCGTCGECQSGNTHICDRYSQPGFTFWGAFAEQVEIRHADINLVSLPDEVDFVTAASLGCRFATSYRAVVRQGRTTGGDWIAVHGCGGVGLSAVMIAHAIGAQVIAIDVKPTRLDVAKRLGAVEIIDASQIDVVKRIREITGRGANVSIDALGSQATCYHSIDCLAKRGRHVQVGLMLGDHANPAIPMGAVIAKELEIYGSHGMQSFEYQPMLQMIRQGTLSPNKLISNVVSLEQGAELLVQMDRFPNDGITVIEI